MNKWIRIMRPVNGLMGFFSIYIIAFIAVNIHIASYIIPVTLGAISVFLVTAGGNVINDISDYESDKINHPKRPLPEGSISRKSAYYFFFFLFIAAFILSFGINFYIPGFILLAEFLLVSYEFKTKKIGLPGNATISFLIGMIFLFGGLLTDTLSKMILLFLLAFFSNMSRELMKDIEDVKGDIDRNTFPKRHGINSAKILSIIFIIATVSISILPYYFKILSIYYVYAVIIDDIMFLTTAYLLFKSVSSAQKISKIAMIWGMFAFLLGGFASL
ncbi:MAG: UbiA family prenyltransferase [Ferroplasma sp.]